MNFPADLQKRWCAKRYQSFNNVLKQTFTARVYKIGLRLDFTCPNRAGQFELFSQAEYVALVINFLERLNPGIIVHRLTGEAYRAMTVVPDWSINKRQLDSRDTWQSRFYRPFRMAAHPLNKFSERSGEQL